MLEFRQKRKIRNMLYSPVTIIGLFIVVVILVKATWNVHVKEAESRVYLDDTQAQLDKISNSQSVLTAQVAGLQTPEGVEAAIRSQFLVAKPGEQIAVIEDGGDDASGTVSGTASSSPPGQGFWGSIVDFFKF